MKKYNLPSFVKLYNIPNEYTIVGKHGKFYIEEEGHKPFDSFYEAFYHVHTELNGKPLFNSSEIAKNSPNIREMGEGMIQVTHKGKTSLYASYSSDERIKNLEEEYEYFLNTTVKNYEKNPKLFINAWEFLSAHPMFWNQNPNLPDYWSTHTGLDDMTITVCVDEKHDGKHMILLEHGPYDKDTVEGVEYEHVIRTLDLDLTAEADTFENAVIMLAEKVYTLYDTDGERR